MACNTLEAEKGRDSLAAIAISSHLRIKVVGVKQCVKKVKMEKYSRFCRVCCEPLKSNSYFVMKTTGQFQYFRS